MSAEFAWAPDQTDTAAVDWVEARNGVDLLRRTWAVEDPRAAVLISHGIAEHSGRYEHVARQLNAAGMTVVGFDQRGHGATTGPQGYVEDFSEFRDDIEDLLADTRRLGVPVVLLGHSMGGLIVASYALDDQRPQPDLVVLSAPALGLPVPKALVRPISGLARLLRSRSITLPLDPEQLATDPRVAEVYQADPLVNLRQTFGLLRALLRTSAATQGSIGDWHATAMVVHGTDDRIVEPSASEPLGEQPSVTRVAYAGLRHELFNEPSGPSVLTDVVGWVNDQLS